MTKAEMIEKIQQKAGIGTKADTTQFFDAFMSVLSEAVVSGEQVSFVGFGSLKLVERAERKGRNPRTGEECLIPASRVVKFTPGKHLKDALNS